MFTISYSGAESYDEEVMFIAVTPGDPTQYTAFREDAENLESSGGEFRFRGESSARLSAAVAALADQQHPVPSFLNGGSNILGRRISLYWDIDSEWFSGTIIGVDEASAKHHVKTLDANLPSVALLVTTCC